MDQAVVLAVPGKAGDLHLISWLTVNRAEMNEAAALSGKDDHVSLWQDGYENVYRQATPGEDVMLNTAGWQSSSTGQPIEAAEMKDWVDQTVEPILALRPGKVLELGCGTGMLLARVAPHCESYTGLDISGAALEHIRKMQESLRGLDRIELYERGADQLSDFLSWSFDTVVINSVMQHFPEVGYLLRVLDEATRLLTPGGHTFLGDVICFPVLESFHTQFRFSGRLTRAPSPN